MPSVTSTLQLEDRMTSVLRSIVKALNTTLTAMASVDKVSSPAFRAASEAVRQCNNEVNKLNSAVQSTTPSVRNMNNSFGGMSNNVRNLTKEIGMLIGVYSGLQAIANVGKSGDTYIGNTARLDLMNDGLQTTLDLQRQIYESSQRSASGYKETTAAVAKLGVTAGHAFNSSKEIVAFTELLNKQFQIGGASATEKAGAMYQLTQAMASGRLQGDEFRSILENAPMLMKAIRNYTGMTFAQLKEASTKGLITADVIKKSLFSIANETNKKFAEMPLKFGDLWTQILNKIDYGLQPLYVKLRGIYNNLEFQVFLTNMVNGFLTLISVTMDAFNIIAHLASWTYDNWNVITPIIWGTVIALTAYKLAALGVAIANGIAAFSESAKGAAMALATGATLAQTAAQWGLNAALYAFPGTWIVLAIIAIITAVYAVNAALNKWLGTTKSVTGAIIATITGAAAIIWNVFSGHIKAIINFLNFFVELIISMVDFLFVAIDNISRNGWKGVVDTAKNFLGQLINLVLSAVKIITSAFDQVFNTDSTKWVSSIQDKVLQWGRSKKSYGFGQRAGTVDKLTDKIGRLSFGKSVDFGYNLGKGIDTKVKDNFRIGDKKYNFADGMDPELIKKAMNGNSVATEAAKQTAKNTKKTADKLDKGIELTSEDIELLKESSRVQFVNRFNNLAPQVNATFGDVHKGADVNAILNYLEEALITAADAALSR